MYILHIETSTKVCSVALSQGDRLLNCIELDEGMNHTAVLAPTIQQLLKGVSIKVSDLGAISVSSGPGSYTGLRVGCATAKAMAYSLNIPILAIPTLTSLADAVFVKFPEAEWALPMLDARRNEVYTSLFDRNMKQVVPVSSVILDEESLMDLIPETGKVVSCGDGAFKLKNMAARFPNLILSLEIQSSATHLIMPALRKLSTGEFSDPMNFVPNYLKPPNITQQRKLL